jgi:hypothetical protein
VPPNKLVSPPKWKKLKPLISDQYNSAVVDLGYDIGRPPSEEELGCFGAGASDSFIHSLSLTVVSCPASELGLLSNHHPEKPCPRMIGEFMRRMPQY